jgi:DNA-binding LacI/PurR family transcriptional regulator
LAERTTPPLDSVLIPAEEVGARAVDLLMRKLDNGTVPASSLLAPRITVRASTSRPPRISAPVSAPTSAPSAARIMT